MGPRAPPPHPAHPLWLRDEGRKLPPALGFWPREWGQDPLRPQVAQVRCLLSLRRARGFVVCLECQTDENIPCRIFSIGESQLVCLDASSAFVSAGGPHSMLCSDSERGRENPASSRREVETPARLWAVGCPGRPVGHGGSSCLSPWTGAMPPGRLLSSVCSLLPVSPRGESPVSWAEPCDTLSPTSLAVVHGVSGERSPPLAGPVCSQVLRP